MVSNSSEGVRVCVFTCLGALSFLVGDTHTLLKLFPLKRVHTA